MNQATLSSRTLGGRDRGIAMIYVVMVMGVMMAFASLGVDLARVQVAKTELRRTADASARYAVTGIADSVAEARARAKAAAAENSADGTPITIQNNDIQFVTWDTVTRTYTVLSGPDRRDANAIRVTVNRTTAEGNAVPLTFASLIGQNTCNVSASAIALFTAAVDVALVVPATSCPWLAGAGNGTVANAGNPANNPDYAPAACPKLMTGVPLVAGTALNFDSISGGAGNGPAIQNFTPDGNPNDVQGNWNGAENGLGNMICPLNAVVGVFLNASNPNSTAAPSTLDFSTPASRNFTTLTPVLKQVFFIGDGKTDGGVAQNFTVPAGATRLFIGTMDGWEWNNNHGNFTTTITRPQQIQLVK